MGSLVQPESDVTDVEAGAAHDDRRHHRGRNRRHDLARRQDVLLLHERERHRAASHLGRADRRRNSDAGDDGQRDRDVSGGVAVRSAHVEPQLVITHPADNAFEIHNQLFLPKDIKPGEKRPAMIFVHGGPVREMLLGYHYRYVYHQFYSANEWLTSKGYVVLSINYRGGVGYGHSFQNAPNTNARGNSEYQDVLAGAQYLQSRPDVDAKRIGIYGLSYGGLLTAESLARNSDIFALGVDYAGVHLYGSSLDPNEVSYQSSAISQIDKWKSPVLIVQGDDDRNVFFAQSVGLVDLLRQRDVYYELIVEPDDTHDSLLYNRWIYMFERMDKFLKKFFGV